jgi:DNA repair exonuclease SbcCD nuclease subunit
MNSKIAFFTDLHLGVHQNGDKWFDIALNWSNWFKDELEKNNVDEIIFGGDFFHYRDEVNVKCLHTANKILDTFKDFKITMITGNHDSYYKDNSVVNSLSILNSKNNVNVIDAPRKIQIKNRELMMCPWGTIMDEIEPADIIFGHFEIQNFKYNNHKVCDHGFNSKDLLDKTNLVVTGHVHKREDGKYDNGTIVYAGNPFETDFSDLGDSKGFYILDFEDLTYKFYQNTVSPNHVKLKTSEIQKLPSYKDRLHNIILKLYVDNDIRIKDLDNIVSKVNSYNPVDLTVDYLHKFNPESVPFTNELSDLNTRECIIEYIDNTIDEEYRRSVIKKTIEIYKQFV